MGTNGQIVAERKHCLPQSKLFIAGFCLSIRGRIQELLMCASSGTSLVPDGESPGLVQKLPERGSRAERDERKRVNGYLILWSWIGLLTLTGLFGVAPDLANLWGIWMTDPLRSIGGLILLTSVVLILRVWYQSKWELRGTLWGLLFVALAFVPVFFSRRLIFFWTVGGIRVNFLPSVLPIYLFAGGIILLFAGPRVWLRAWFPLALLLCLQPVPFAMVCFLDLPLQALSAHIARSFAQILGLYPTNSELLRLMFTPDFGMFIAPGCDGMRGAITLAYAALIVGYLKQVRILRWIIYVAGAFILGHVFNLLRLCALVAYYKVALDHPFLEHLAKQADYVIGGLLFLIAVFLFLVVVSRKENKGEQAGKAKSQGEYTGNIRATYWRATALTLLVFAVIPPGVRATERSHGGLATALERGEVTLKDLDDRIPSQVGSYRLARAWQEYLSGSPVLETAAFEAASSDQIELGVWLPLSEHRIEASLSVRGKQPKFRATETFATARGKSAEFSTALYDDGTTVSLVGDTYCSPDTCRAAGVGGIHLSFTNGLDQTMRGQRWVPIFFKIQTPHAGASDDAVYRELSAESQEFLSNLDFLQLSEHFQ